MAHILPPPTNEANTISSPTNKHGRKFYHVLLDPRFDGETVARYRWFMMLSHSVEGSSSGVDVVRKWILMLWKQGQEDVVNDDDDDDGEVYLVVVSHYLDDHCHRGSVVQCGVDVPVLTVRGGAALVEGWKHFENVLVMPDVDLEGRVEELWRGQGCDGMMTQVSGCYLPQWLRVGRLGSGERFPELPFATLFAYDAGCV